MSGGGGLPDPYGWVVATGRKGRPVYVDFENVRRMDSDQLDAMKKAFEGYGAHMAVYMDEVSSSFAKMAAGVQAGASSVRAFGADLEASLCVGGPESGVAWPTADARAKAGFEEMGLERTIAAYWSEEKVVGSGFTGGFVARGGRKPTVEAKRARRVRTGGSACAWVPLEAGAGQKLPTAARKPQERIPADVLEAERELKHRMAVLQAQVEAERNLGHTGPVGGPNLLPLPGSDEKTLTVVMDWECAACGAVSGDEELFRELGCAE